MATSIVTARVTTRSQQGAPEAPEGNSPESGGTNTIPTVPVAPKKGKKAVGKAADLKNQQIRCSIPSGDKAQEAAGKGGRTSAQGAKNSQQENPRDDPPPEREVSNPPTTEGNVNEKSPPPIAEGPPAKPSEARSEGPSHNSWDPMPPTAEQLMATINQYLQAAGTRWMERSAGATPGENHGVNPYAHQAGCIATLRAQFVQATREADASTTDHLDRPAQTAQGTKDEGDDLYVQSPMKITHCADALAGGPRGKTQNLKDKQTSSWSASVRL
ncbi:hypothetical protein BV22DRAFT_1134306 [Leucogyrophana mollusca]|uniref:Uncharacterized protein n=1 Tax=Leucogyrophana mollusca TaxID=85980 RepID=A0ACB8AZ65_9AGAM|nr:hypothetical protein BV22DRAFT_1134306 [Leucogyrophana mollusca]